jgi:hypothetical protein
MKDHSETHHHAEEQNPEPRTNESAANFELRHGTILSWRLSAHFALDCDIKQSPDATSVKASPSVASKRSAHPVLDRL